MLEGEADETDNDERGEHYVGFKELLGVEDDPAKPKIRGGQHLGAYNGDPGA